MMINMFTRRSLLVLKLIGAFLLLQIAVFGSNEFVSAQVYDTMTTSELYNLLQSYPDAHIYDIRSIQQYEAGHLGGSICIPFEEIRENLNILPTDKNALIVSYCSCPNGENAKFFSEILAEQGYTNLMVLTDPIEEWLYSPLIKGEDPGDRNWTSPNTGNNGGGTFDPGSSSWILLLGGLIAISAVGGFFYLQRRNQPTSLESIRSKSLSQRSDGLDKLKDALEPHSISSEESSGISKEKKAPSRRRRK